MDGLRRLRGEMKKQGNKNDFQPVRNDFSLPSGLSLRWFQA